MENLPSNGVLLDDSSIEQLREHDIRPFLCYWDYFGLIDVVFVEEAIENTDETVQINIKFVAIKPLMQKLGQPLLEVMDMLGSADATLEDFFSAILGIDSIMDEQQISGYG
ncbi:hypothetical protein P5G51_006790 [Virgibacillus sp. 179-BFC.A HS]|uniref:Uncharacterized protein n=1 Tax=Tigheibacillus jepli TaxID=3035914 RepID=A0ABU5CGP0_9BACI|nr:hypothetical protein [Virgibacillus sp. 179-BFC.A HS]MDY0405146.1 hypothetical protein [Virgibacillus sp. 179-BFC.A HS]